MPTIELDAANDSPRSVEETNIEISGIGFEPGTSVNIELIFGSKRLTHLLDVEADGSFEWLTSLNPKLNCGAGVRAVVKGADGTEVEADAEVFCP